MKKYLLILAFTCFMPAMYSSLYAQTLTIDQVEKSVKRDGKYAILVQNLKHFQVTVMTGEEMKKSSPKIQFEIVVIGSVVKDLAEDGSLKALIENCKKLGIRIVVCEYAMKMFDIKKEQYDPYLSTTPNAFIYLFGLQENGFKTIIL